MQAGREALTGFADLDRWIQNNLMRLQTNISLCIHSLLCSSTQLSHFHGLQLITTREDR